MTSILPNNYCFQPHLEFHLQTSQYTSPSGNDLPENQNYPDRKDLTCSEISAIELHCQTIEQNSIDYGLQLIKFLLDQESLNDKSILDTYYERCMELCPDNNASVIDNFLELCHRYPQNEACCSFIKEFAAAFPEFYNGFAHNQYNDIVCKMAYDELMAANEAIKNLARIKF